jgi:hypothetical protein
VREAVNAVMGRDFLRGRWAYSKRTRPLRASNLKKPSKTPH